MEEVNPTFIVWSAALIVPVAVIFLVAICVFIYDLIIDDY